MKSHRPWQPHMSGPPQLFNPYTPPTGRDMTLDHFNIVEEEEESDSSDDPATDQAAAAAAKKA